jgi:hypothetical protein
MGPAVVALLNPVNSLGVPTCFDRRHRAARRRRATAIRSEEFVKIAEEPKFGRIQLDVVVRNREPLDPLRSEVHFDVRRRGFEIEVPVPTPRMTAVDETDVSFAVDEDIVEPGIPVNHDEIFGRRNAVHDPFKDFAGCSPWFRSAKLSGLMKPRPTISRARANRVATVSSNGQSSAGSE